jgi:hypothetical protein
MLKHAIAWIMVLFVCSVSGAAMLDFSSSQFIEFNSNDEVTYEVNFSPEEQLAVEANARYRDTNGSLVSGPLAAMVGPLGEHAHLESPFHQSVYIFSVNSATGVLSQLYSYDLTAQDGRSLGCPRFMELPYNPADPEWCLVVPNRATDTKSGSIDIIRLQYPSEPLVCHNRLTMLEPPVGYTLSHVYSIAYIPFLDSGTSTTPFCISSEYANPQSLLSFFGLASFVNDKFIVAADDRKQVLDVFYGNSAESNPTRPCESQECSFSLDGVSRNLIVSTSHNGGVVIWDPLSSSNQQASVVSQILSPQNGWQPALAENCPDGIGELGDVHRAAVIEGADFSLNGQSGSIRLMFFGNNTMGFCVYDVSNPASPQFVWQWDGDTRLPSDYEDDWNWSGTVCSIDNVPLDIPDQANPVPGRVWGMDLVYNDTSGDIRVFVGDCAEGLLAFDMSYFLNPFNLPEGASNRSFDEITAERYWPGNSQLSEICGAFDTRVMHCNGKSFVVTSWMLPSSNRIAISVHEIDGGSWTTDYQEYSQVMESSASIIQTDITLTGSSPNPASETFSIDVLSTGASSCSVTVFDLSGRVVRVFGSELQTGPNSIVWNCRDSENRVVPAGNYFLRVDDSNGDTLVEKMVVI